MTPGQTIQSIENNMYRCPIYEHKLPSTDFIVIRTRTEFSIRECNAFFVSGQKSPLSESRAQLQEGQQFHEGLPPSVYLPSVLEVS